MPYQPQPGERKHKRLIGDCIAANEIAIGRLAMLKEHAKNAETKLVIERIHTDLLGNAVRFYEMLEIVKND